MEIPIAIICIVLVIIIYVWRVQFYRAWYPKIFIDDVIKQRLLKTGDLILFKAYNNFNSVFTSSYFGHIGVVYVDPDDPEQVPMLFETNGIESMALRDHHNKNGVFFTPLADRVRKYKGRVFVKSLSSYVSSETERDFREFIDYCLSNMRYDTHVVQSGIKKRLGLERCRLGTNCGELTFLCLIKLGLLNISRYDEPVLNHLKWMTGIEKLDNGMTYHDLVELIDHPFSE